MNLYQTKKAQKLKLVLCLIIAKIKVLSEVLSKPWTFFDPGNNANFQLTFKLKNPVFWPFKVINLVRHHQIYPETFDLLHYDELRLE